MKKLFVITMGLVAGFLLATAANAAIVGTAHDFSGEGWSGGQICITCHTPHHADTTVAEAPLWNHELTTASYTLYSSDTLDAVLDQPTGVSKLCLSCHDGTVALENFGGTTGGGTFVTGDELIGGGGDLSDHHPISFVYDDTLAVEDGELFDPLTQNSGLGGTIDADMLFGTSLQCASCHDVHDAGFGNLLLMSNQGSALCLTCHNK